MVISHLLKNGSSRSETSVLMIYVGTRLTSSPIQCKIPARNRPTAPPDLSIVVTSLRSFSGFFFSSLQYDSKVAWAFLVATFWGITPRSSILRGSFVALSSKGSTNETLWGLVQIDNAFNNSYMNQLSQDACSIALCFTSAFEYKMNEPIRTLCDWDSGDCRISVSSIDMFPYTWRRSMNQEIPVCRENF